jgi:predicted dinucleotide-binding enzyme
MGGSARPSPERGRPILTICGGGNAGHALAVVASQNFDGDIRWLVGSEEKADLLRRQSARDGLRSSGLIEASADRLGTISSRPEQVIPGAELVLLVVPAFMHASVLRRIAPHLDDNVVIGCLPTRGGFEFEATQLVLAAYAGRRSRLFGLQTLPWSTRVVKPGELVNFGAAKTEVLVSALPSGDAAELASQLSSILGTKVVPTDSFLNLTLGNPGQFIHPGLMWGAFGTWDGEPYEADRVPLLYAEASDATGRLVEEMSRDAMSVARAIEVQSGGALDLSGVVPVHEWLKSAYSHVTDDLSSVATCFRTGPIQARKAPMLEVSYGKFVPNFDYRYLSEDVPFGLVVTRAIAEVAGVATPAIDEVIVWAQSNMRKAYINDGRVTGRDVSDLPVPQNYGVTTLPRLVEWYSDAAARHPRRALGRV